MQNLDDFFRSKSCFLWDFDGTVGDTEKIHFLAYQSAFGSLGHHVDETLYYQNFTHKGRGIKGEIDEHGLRMDPNEIAVKKAKIYQDMIEKNLPPVFPEIPAILKALQKRSCVSCIATNSPKQDIDYILGNFAKEFDFIIGKTDDLRKKPAPDIFLAAIKKWGGSFEDALVIEDSDRGLEAAHAARIDAIFVVTDYNRHLKLDAPCVAKLSHAEILAILERLTQKESRKK